MNDLVQWVALATAGRIGKKTIAHLLEHFDTLEAVFEASINDLMQVPTVGQKTAANLKGIDLEQTKYLIERCQQAGITILTLESEAFPKPLSRLPGAPIVLFCRGDVQHLSKPAVAIVGTRTPTTERVEFAVQLGEQLAILGWAIVSGLALGIDTAGHVGALRGDGTTIAVLGGGLNRLYPRENTGLAKRIEELGVVLSEVAPDVNVSPSGLRARNRITSGLSTAVFVVQANKDSGSLATARLARKQGRAVYAVNGDDEGCQQLIAAGAEAISMTETNWDALHHKLQSFLK